MDRRTAHVVQLPFPSASAPHPLVVDYYRDYSRAFARFIDGYFIPEGSLWELPLWVAHMTGMLEHIGLAPLFDDLSATPPTEDACTRELLSRTAPGELVLLSPLAQNFRLAVGVSRRLMAEQRVVVLGGNMSTLADAGDATIIHHGQATPQSLRASLYGNAAVVTNTLERRGVAGWRPEYRLLEPYRGRVPLLRLNASHGCLYACDFCGDAWSRTLAVVPRDVLEHEVRQFERLFPDTRLIYIGDKTFGQSKAAVRNLIDVFARRPQYRFIVQTHVLAVNDDVLDAMVELGVVVVEMGFESASTKLLQDNHKGNRNPDFYVDRMRRIEARGIRVVLNILSGLPTEDRAAHDETAEFIGSRSSDAWLFNLYNFVPYPLTPSFPELRSRIFDWDFANWREDAPPVFEPYHCTPDESFSFFLEKVRVAQRTVRHAHAAADARPLPPGDGPARLEACEQP
jgi:hypothetical protein